MTPENDPQAEPLPKLTSKGLPVVSEQTIRFMRDEHDKVDLFGISERVKRLMNIQDRLIHDLRLQYLKEFIEEVVEKQIPVLFEPFEIAGVQFENPEEEMLLVGRVLVQISMETIAVLDKELRDDNHHATLPMVTADTLKAMRGTHKDPVEWNNLLKRIEVSLDKENPHLAGFLSEQINRFSAWNGGELTSAMLDVALSTLAIFEHQATADRLADLYNVWEWGDLV